MKKCHCEPAGRPVWQSLQLFEEPGDSHAGAGLFGMAFVFRMCFLFLEQPLSALCYTGISR